ncbi:MAG: dehydrogenase [Rhodopirellula sp.]|nr:dehydrogenase [Rhodopirellula sp.]OUX50740.1 MAG: dehydrogenase [Rhodopirellula sp. TMED283]
MNSEKSRPVFAVVCCATLLMITTVAQADDWSGWRGPEGNNHAPDDTDVPLRWNIESETNIIWKTAIPGRGHSSPVVVKDSIFLTTAETDNQTQSLLKFDRESGRMMDQWVLHRGTLPRRIHPNNSYASPTPVFDGENLFVVFHTDDAIWLTAVTTSGQKVWTLRVCDFKPGAFQFGYGASPLIEDDLVIVAAEYDGAASGIYAFSRRTGKQVWMQPRPENLNFSSPIIATITGQRQLLLAGANTIISYDPQTGQKRWSIDAGTEAMCGTVAWDGRRVLFSGGNPVAGTWCVSGDGSQKLLWQNPVMCYEQSLLTIKNYAFAIADNGVAYCWRTQDGVEMWKKRLFAGRISASPLLVDQRIYIAAQDGTVYVISAIPDRFDLLAENNTGDSIFASPVAVDDRLYIRYAKGQGQARKEYLVAAGEVTVEKKRGQR